MSSSASWLLSGEITVAWGRGEGEGEEEGEGRERKQDSQCGASIRRGKFINVYLKKVLPKSEIKSLIDCIRIGIEI